MPTDETGDGLQFDKAEFATPAGLNCKVCKSPIADSYFTVNGHTVCASCRDKLGSGVRPITPAALVLASVFGFIAAILAAAAWGAFLAFRNENWGFLAIGAGYVIGTAIRKGSGGVGGGVYQALAMILTYLCIALSWLPVALPRFANSEGRFVEIALFLMMMPILVVKESLLSAIIYGFGFYQAWKLTRRAPWVVAGPLRIASSSPAPEAFANG